MTVYNFDGLNCPRCYRRDALTRPMAAQGTYECRPGCGARFRFIAATEERVAGLQHETDTPQNAGAREADDWRCPGCSARGFIVFCGSCTQDLYSGARR